MEKSKKSAPQPSSKRKTDGGEKKWQPRSILQDSGDGPANKKRALRRQRASTKPNFEAVTASKLLWNELREKKCSQERREELVGELHGALKGKYAGVAMKHDAARLVQAVIIYGTESQRSTVMDEIAGRTPASGGAASGSGGGDNAAQFLELCRSPYGHYVVVKLLEHARSKELQRKLTSALSGHIVSLSTHSVGARIVELALCGGGCLRPSQSAGLRLELFGREFTVFADEMKRDLQAHYRSTLGLGPEAANVSCRPTLSGVLAVRADKKERVLESVGTLVNKLAQKGLLAFQYAHEILSEYVEEVEGAALEECLGFVVDNCLVLLSTRPGTKAVCVAAARGQAKDRRRLLKLIKGHVASLLTHRDAYLAVLELCEVVDDTVALQKSLLSELCTAPSAEDLAKAQVFSANPFLDEKPKKKSAQKGAAEDEDEEEGGKNMSDDEDEDADDDEEEEDGDDDDEEDEEEEEEEEEGDDDDEEGADDDGDVDSNGDDDDALTRAVPLLSVALHPNGSKLLLRILAGTGASDYSSSSGGGGGPDEEEGGSGAVAKAKKSLSGSERYLDPYELAVLATPSPASKKDPGVRREELRAFLQEPLLLQVLAPHAPLLLESHSGASVLTEALKCFAPLASPLPSGTTTEVGRAAEAVAQVAAQYFDHPIAHAALKRVLLAEAHAEKEGGGGGGGGTSSSAVLSSAIVALAQNGASSSSAAADASAVASCDLAQWALGSNRGAFVVWALLQVPSQGPAAAALLAPQRDAIDDRAAAGGAKDGGGGGEKKKKKKEAGITLVSAALDHHLPNQKKQSRGAAKTPNAKGKDMGKAPPSSAKKSTTKKAQTPSVATPNPSAAAAEEVEEPGVESRPATASKAKKGKATPTPTPKGKKASPAVTRSARKART